MSLPMQPMCATCPYWKEYRNSEGVCEVGFAGKGSGADTGSDEGVRFDIRDTEPDDWCGVHPDFKAWFFSRYSDVRPPVR